MVWVQKFSLAIRDGKLVCIKLTFICCNTVLPSMRTCWGAVSVVWGCHGTMLKMF